MKRREARVRIDGDATLRLLRLTGEEELGRPFRYDLVLESDDPDLELKGLLGKKLCVELDATGDGKRYVNGYIADAAYAGTSLDKAHYRLMVVPWLWFLDRNADCRVFQEMDVLEIVEQTFGRSPIADFKKKIVGIYQKRTYCVQYRESDLDFASRLLEDEGIYYFFEHTDAGHKLVLIDDVGSHEPASGYETVPFYPPDARGHRERDFLDTWRAATRVRSGKSTLRDFDFEKPATDLTASDSDPKEHEQARAELYDYPGGYVQLDHGDERARLRREADQAEHGRSEGAGNAAGLCCGRSFKLDGLPRRDQNIEHLIVTLESDISLEGTRSATDGEADPYRCRLVAQPLRTPFRPGRRTPVPFVHGPQTAIVTGPPGEEIYTDKYGRVKVKFHWDRYGTKDEQSSCWVRVSQAWAGGGFGSIHIPRVGQEVIVDFLEGDPDRPIITGRVYNALQMPPHALPGSAVKSGLKSNSTKGGGGSNELTFDDSKGKEKVYFHAQYDHTGDVEHDETWHVKNNRTDTVDVDETRTVHGKRSLTIDKGDTVHVDSGRKTTVTGGDSLDVTGDRTVTSTTLHKTVAPQVEVKATAAYRLETPDADLNGTAKVAIGSNLITIDGTKITLSAGGSSIELSDGGITITSGAPITITGAVVKVNS